MAGSKSDVVPVQAPPGGPLFALGAIPPALLFGSLVQYFEVEARLATAFAGLTQHGEPADTLLMISIVVFGYA